MENGKGIDELKNQLIDLQQDMIESISAELVRIGRAVKMNELNFVPFNDEVQDYIVAIRLDSDFSPVLDTSFNNLKEKYLSSFISDSEIDHWRMISLLGMLKDIENDAEHGNILKIVDINYGQLSKDFITFIWSQQPAWRDQVSGTDLYDPQDILLNQSKNSPYPDDILVQLSEIGNLLREQDCRYFRVIYS